MKQKLISRLVIGALAGVAAAGAFAGQIQASSVSIAREVITTNTQAVTSPSISYRFAGDIDARIQAQTIQVQFILPASSSAKWASSGAASGTGTGTQPATALLATGAAIGAATTPQFPQLSITDGVSGTRIAQADTVPTANTAYTVDTLDVSPDGKTLYATITFRQNPNNLVKQPIISISASAVAADNPTVNGLFDVVGAIGECDVSVKTLGVGFKHYVALSSPASVATDTTATPDEHNRLSSTNNTTLITFPTNILVKVDSSAGNTKVNVASGGLNFSGSATTPTSGSAAPDVWVSATLANLGRVSLVQNAQGYDSNLSNQYLLAGSGTGLSGVATAAVNNGVVEAANVRVTVAASQGFVQGGVLSLSRKQDCSTNIPGTVTPITALNAAGPISLTIAAANLGGGAGAFGTSGFDSLGGATAAGTGPVYVCYNVAGVTTPIPGSAFSVTAATVNKAAAGAGRNEQNNFCKGNLFALSGSVKIDVRNYASAGRSDKWVSVLRVVNPSETRTVDVFGQYIFPDGTYGRWGKLGTLAPRAAVNWDAQTVDAALTNAPAHVSNSALNNTGALPAAGTAPRLRITSPNADTLRVQNYLYNPDSKNFIEASSTQGVDFAGNTDRAPVGEGQYQDQDAHKGLNGGN